MKRVTVFLIMLSLCVLSIWSQETKQTQTPSTQFEQVLLQKGSLIVKEFIDYNKVGLISGQIAVLSDVNKNTKIYALRLTHLYYNSKYDSGESVGVLDAQEINSAIQTLDFIRKQVSILTDSSPYTEVVYTSNSGIVIGMYKSGKDSKIFIKFDYKDTAFIDMKQFDELYSFFTGAKAKIVELGGVIK